MARLDRLERSWPVPPGLSWPCRSRRPRSLAKGGQGLGGESAELGELIVADEADAEIADPRGGVAPERGDHHVGGAEPHRAARVDAASVVSRQKLRGHAL